MGKVVSQDELILHRGEWKRNGKSVVFTSGAFDLLHPGHVRLLEQARELGDVLVVGVETDASVRKRHGSKHVGATNDVRPITPAEERMEILAALAAVDYVAEYDAASLKKFLARLRPDVVAEGSSESGQAQGRAGKGGKAAAKIVRIPLEPGYSTSRIIERIKQLPA